jgi:SHS2 domain-containing protein
MRRFEFLGHTADTYIAAYGSDLSEAFENAALALFEVMTDTEKVEPEVEEVVEVEGFDKQSLLYNWLEELLVKFETEGKLYSKFKVLSIKEHEDGFRLKAKVIGEIFNPEKHPQKVGVKAVTYHMMEIKERPDKVTLKFLLDI